MEFHAGRGPATDIAGEPMTHRPRVLAVVALAALGCGGEPPASAAAARTAVTLSASDVAVARLADLTDGVAISGTLEPVQSVALTAQVAARVRRVTADRGTQVRRGEVLVELDAEGIRGQAEGTRAAVASAEAALALAAQRLESARRLHAAGGIADIDLRASEAAHRAAEAQLAAARAQAAGAQENESHTRVASPIDGIVSARGVEPGESVKDGAMLLTVVDISTLELVAHVGVDEAMRVRVGAPVTFTIDATGGQAFTGRVARVDPRADPGTRQVGIASTLPNPGGRIVAGQFARGRVLLGTVKSVVAVPVRAVTDSAGVASVLLIEGGRLVRRRVSLGARDEAQGLVAVTEGLAEGDRVLAVPVPGAADGLAVTMGSDTGASRRVSPAAPDTGRGGGY
jgi:membrane fusion protein (multidrug efflux system)